MRAALAETTPPLLRQASATELERVVTWSEREPLPTPWWMPAGWRDAGLIEFSRFSPLAMASAIAPDDRSFQPDAIERMKANEARMKDSWLPRFWIIRHFGMRYKPSEMAAGWGRKASQIQQLQDEVGREFVRS